MKRPTFSLIFILAITNAMIAGKNYPGYVILNDDVRIEGIIDMLSPTLNEVKVKILTNEGQEVSYKAKDIKEYGFVVTNWDEKSQKATTETIVYERKKVIHATIAFGSNEALLKRELQGAISLYNHYYERNANIDENIGQSFYVQQKKGELIWLNQENYKEVLKSMTADYSELNVLIGTKNFSYKYVYNIIQAYNTWKGDNGEETVSNSMK
jgi:hypothetical protein